MRLALAITSLFPSGGLQRDCLAIAAILSREGHEVSIVTADYRHPVELGGLNLLVWPTGGWTNPGRDQRFGIRLAADAAQFDRIVGFNKIPGLDIYYCADPPFAETKTSLAHRLSPRLCAQQMLERGIFGPHSRTSILVLADRQIESYRRAWATPKSRFRMVPPTLNLSRRRPDLRLSARAAVRASLGLADGVIACLAIASAPRTKGTDRIVTAMARVPGSVLLVAGVFPGSRDANWIMRQARREGVAGRIRLLGHREDIPELMAAADVFVHPARRETTGNAILESVANGLPVVVTELCGYAKHVAQADAGILLPDPFRQKDLTDALAATSDPAERARWSRNGTAYGADPTLASGHAMAAASMVGPLWM